MPRWFLSHKFVDHYATQLVDRFAAKVPAGVPMDDQHRMTRKSANVTIFAIRQLVDSAHHFQREEKLNLFQRARLAQQLQDQLISRGYPVELVREMTTAFVDAAGIASAAH